MGLQKLMDRFEQPWEDSDVELIVEDISFHCHSLILRLNSPVFAAMLGNYGFVEAREKRVQLPGRNLNVVL